MPAAVGLAVERSATRGFSRRGVARERNEHNRLQVGVPATVPDQQRRLPPARRRRPPRRLRSKAREDDWTRLQACAAGSHSYMPALRPCRLFGEVTPGPTTTLRTPPPTGERARPRTAPPHPLTQRGFVRGHAYRPGGRGHRTVRERHVKRSVTTARALDIAASIGREPAGPVRAAVVGWMLPSPRGALP